MKHKLFKLVSISWLLSKPKRKEKTKEKNLSVALPSWELIVSAFHPYYKVALYLANVTRFFQHDNRIASVCNFFLFYSSRITYTQGGRKRPNWMNYRLAGKSMNTLAKPLGKITLGIISLFSSLCSLWCWFLLQVLCSVIHSFWILCKMNISGNSSSTSPVYL